MESNSYKKNNLNENILQLVANKSIINFSLYIFRVAASFLTIVLASRWLGVEKFGEFNLLLSYTVYLSYFLGLGFDQSLPYFVSKSVNEEKARPLSLFVKVIEIISYFGISVLTVAAVFILIFWRVEDESRPLIAMFLITFQHFIFAIGNVCAAYLRGYKIFKPWILKEQVVTPAMLLILLVIFVKFLDLGILGYALAYALAITSAFCVVIYFLLPFLKKQISQKSKQSMIGIKEMVKFSFPLGMMGSLEQLVIWTSIALTGHFLAVKDAGLITVSIRLAIFVRFLLASLRPIFSPYIAELLRTDQSKEVKKLYQMVNYWSTKWALLTVFLIAIASETLLRIFGVEFLNAQIALYLVLPGIFFDSVCGAALDGLTMGGINWFGALSYLVAIVVNILFSYLLVEQFQINGMAIALSLSFFILNFLRGTRFYVRFRILPVNRKHLINLFFMFITLLFLGYFIHTFFTGRWEKLTLGFLVFVAGLAIGFWKDGRFFMEYILERLQKKQKKVGMG